MYKVPEGKAENSFALGERCMPKSYAMTVIAETHKFWKDLTEVNSLNASGSGMKREGSTVCAYWTAQLLTVRWLCSYMIIVDVETVRLD